MEGEPAQRRPRVLIGSTGSVASIKTAALCHLLLEFADVKLVVTEPARHFIKEDDLPEAVRPVLGDEAEWRAWKQVGDPVMHIELRRWADLLLLAPLSANSLAKAAGGLADNVLTCVLRAWDWTRPVLVAPAMNTAMWDSPFTARHLAVLAELGASVVPPVAKRLACGDTGVGAMADPRVIADAVRQALADAGFGGLAGAAAEGAARKAEGGGPAAPAAAATGERQGGAAAEATATMQAAASPA